MRLTTIGSQVKVVIDGKNQDGKIVDVITQGAARIELGENNHVTAEYALTGADGTFHYPDEQIAKPSSKPKPAPAASNGTGK